VVVVILFSSVQSAADHAPLKIRLHRHPAAQMSVAKADASEQIRFD